MKNILLTFTLALLICISAVAQQTSFMDSLIINTDEDTFWWAGVINDGYKMPMKPGYHADFTTNSGNQAQPLILSNKGQVIWSDKPYKLNYTSGKLVFKGKSVNFLYHKAGENLKDAYNFASKNYFPPSGKMPDKLLFTRPQYNTWIELVYNQNQKDVMSYARNIVANGFPPGVLMIDDNWQEDYGKWEFSTRRFKDPKGMIGKLHNMGFKVMVWICPFISPDSEVFRYLAKEGMLILDVQKTEEILWENTQNKVAIMRWWNGASACLDLSNPKTQKWFTEKLN